MNVIIEVGELQALVDLVEDGKPYADLPVMQDGVLTASEFDWREYACRQSLPKNKSDFDLGFAAACYFYRTKIREKK